MIRAGVVGALAGMTGTLAMSALMLPAQRLGVLGTQPPRLISDRLVPGAAGGMGRHATERERRLGTVFVHLGVGAAAGAALSVGRAVGLAPRLTPPIAVAFGCAFWAVNYVGIAPAIDLLPSPDRDRPGRPIVMLLAHALFGVVSGALIEVGARQWSAGLTSADDEGPETRMTPEPVDGQVYGG
jgi:hypothetical protein